MNRSHSCTWSDLSLLEVADACHTFRHWATGTEALAGGEGDSSVVERFGVDIKLSG